MKKLLILLLFYSLNHSLKAQHQEIGETPKIWQGDSLEHSKPSNVFSAFKKGKVNGHFRYYFSGIDNDKNLSDYIGSAIGGGLRFETDRFKNFSFGVSGFYIFNAGSSDLDHKDPTSGQSNRYEIGLFDVTDPSNISEISRLEELFLKYDKQNTSITFGRQLINTPFISGS